MPPVGPIPSSDEDCVYSLMSGEDNRVYVYRLKQLLRLGIDELTAIALAEIQDSPHSVERLVACGCDVETAAAIVL